MRMALLLFLLGLLSCCSSYNKSGVRNNLFSDMWQIDTCGLLEYRFSIAMYIITSQEKHQLFKSKKDVLSILGKPYESMVSGDGEVLKYFVNAIEDCTNWDYKQSGVILSSLNFYTNNKGNIIDVRLIAY